MSLGNNLKKMRISKGFTQKELADNSGVTRESIGNYERGDRTPPADMLKKIAIALNVSVDTLTCDESFEREILTRAMQLASKNPFPDSDSNVFMTLGWYADYDTITNFYTGRISNLPTDCLKGLLNFISEKSEIEFNKIFTDLIEANIYDNLDDEIIEYCLEIFSQKSNVLDSISDSDIELLKSLGAIKNGRLVDSISLNKDNTIRNIKRINVLKPSSFDEVKNTVDKLFPTLEPLVQLLTNPKIETTYNYSYNDLVCCGYDNLLIMAIEKAIKTTLSEINEHKEKGDLFDGLGSWISKESPVYEIIKKSQEDNKKAMNKMIEKSKDDK